MASTSGLSHSHADYTVACICPMDFELAPVQAILDDIHEPLPASRNQNAYTLGRIGEHKIVIAVGSKINNNTAAVVATQLQNDFPSIQFAFLVGIGGGVPGDADVRLGDVVVSQPTDTFGGVVQYDLGKRLEGGLLERTGSLREPPAVLSANVRKLQAQHRRLGHNLSQYLSEMLQKYPAMQDEYSFPATERDQLFVTTYQHQLGPNCGQCDVKQTVSRPDRSSNKPKIHYGTIGSANIVLKDATLRDELYKDMGILCVEMEAAGLMNDFPCLVIRGICDYADSHKNKKWQPYAAAMAAAYMKELLAIIPAQAAIQPSHVMQNRASMGAYRNYSGAIQNSGTNINGDVSAAGNITIAGNIMNITANISEVKNLICTSPKVFESLSPSIRSELQKSAEGTMSISGLLLQYRNEDASGPRSRSELARLSETSDKVLETIRDVIKKNDIWDRPVHKIEEVEEVVVTLNSATKSLELLNDEMMATIPHLKRALESRYRQSNKDNASAFSVTNASIQSLSEGDVVSWNKLLQDLKHHNVSERVANKPEVRQKIIALLTKLDEDASDSQSINSTISWTRSLGSRRQFRSVDLRRLVTVFKEAHRKPLAPGDRLIKACKNGTLDEVENALNDGSDVNARNIEGQTPLICAVRRGDEIIVQYLLERGADAELADAAKPPALRRTPLIAAVEAGVPNILALLLDFGASANGESSEFHGAALDLAVYRQHFDCTSMLLRKGADPDIKLHRLSLLDRVVTKNQDTFVRLLLKHGATPTEVQLGPADQKKLRFKRAPLDTLQLAVWERHTQSLEAILEHFGPLSKQKLDDSRLLFLAAADGWNDVVTTLLNFGADPQLITVACPCIMGRDAENYWCQMVHVAIDIKHHETVLCNAMHIAILNKHSKIAKQLVNVVGTDMTVWLENPSREGHKRQTTLFHLALEYGDLDIVRNIRMLGGNVHALDGFGRTALHYIPNMPTDRWKPALSYFNRDMINAQDHQGRTALHASVLAASASVTTLLIQNGARVELADFNGVTPLHLAVITFYDFDKIFALMKVLLHQKADANAVTNDGDTALHLLARKVVHPSEILQMMVQLVSEGKANLDAKDAQNYTARSRLSNTLRMWVLEGVDQREPKTRDNIDLFDFDKPSRKYHDLDVARQCLFTEENV